MKVLGRVTAAWIVVAAVLALPASAAAFGPLAQFSSNGTGPGQLWAPGGGEFAPNGDLYVADTFNSRVSVFTPSGSFLFSFGQAGSGAGSIDEPGDVAVDGAGNVFVADRGNNRVDVFSGTGEFLYAFGRKVELGGAEADLCTTECQRGAAPAGAEPGAIPEPSGIDVGGGKAFVAEAPYARIDVFSTAGAFLYSFGSGKLASPYGVDLDALGRVQVTDPGENRVDTFTSEGVFVRAFGADVGPAGADVCSGECFDGSELGGVASFREPTALDSDGAGNLLVADAELNRLSEFTSSGTFVRAFGEGVLDGAAAFEVCTVTCGPGAEGTIPGAIPQPYGALFGPGDRIYTIEEAGEFAITFSRVQVFGEPSPAPLAKAVQVRSSAGALKTSPRFKLGRLRLNEKKGTATLFVEVPGSGRIVLAGKDILKVIAPARHAGSAALPVRLTGTALFHLRRAGVATVKAKVTFTPKGGRARAKSKKLTLKKG
jgi:NHL repeat-containing protein